MKNKTDAPAENAVDRDARAAAFRISKKRTLIELAVLLLSGGMMTLAFAPANLAFFAYVSVIPLIWLCAGRTKKRAFLYGLVWGYGWHVTCMWFLCEIMFFIPFIFAVILGLFNAVFAMCIPPLFNNLLYSESVRRADFDERAKFHDHPAVGEIAATFTLAALWVLLEWVRSWIFTGFPWDLLGASQWQNNSLIQICEYTGVYGVSFIVILMNVAAFFAIRGFRYSLPEGKYKRPFPLLIAIVILITANSIGVTIFNRAFTGRIRGNTRTDLFSVGVVQPNLTQRREGKPGQSMEALEQCAGLTKDLIRKEKDNMESGSFLKAATPQKNAEPGNMSFSDIRMMKDLYPLQLIVWPESAVPRVYYNYADYEAVLADAEKKVRQDPSLLPELEKIRRCMPFEAGYRKTVRDLMKGFPEASILLGTITHSPESGETYNSALLLHDSKEDPGKFNYDQQDVYSKVHLVPYGEFVPLAKTWPALDGIFGMGRSLSPGKSFHPLKVAENVRAGTLICYEDVFAYAARAQARAGANLLMVITNDAWYPTTSEPEQHYINSIFRTIETRLPMVRAGNGNYSVYIDQFGRLQDSVFFNPDGDGGFVFYPERRSKGSAKFLVLTEKDPQMTFYTKFGDVFVLFCGLLALLGGGWAAARAWHFYRGCGDPLAEKRAQMRADFLKSENKKVR